MSASASSYDWTAFDKTEYVYTPFILFVQNDNISYRFAVDGHLTTYGDALPYQTFYSINQGAEEVVYGFYCSSSVDGMVEFSFPAYSIVTPSAEYPSSLPTIDITGTPPSDSRYFYSIDFVLARPTADGTLDVQTDVYTYLLELPYFDIEDAYSRFCDPDSSPVFPPDDTVAIVTQIAVEYSSTGDVEIEVLYPYASNAFDSYPNVTFAPPDVDVDSIIEEAYRSGVQAGYNEGYEQGLNNLEEFNPAQWLLNILESVFAFKLIPIGSGISVGAILAVLLVVPFAIWFLRLFAGG